MPEEMTDQVSEEVQDEVYVEPETDDIPVVAAEEPAKEEEAKAYQADFSYKVYDDVKEIPEFYRSLITDKESEEQVRTLFCKADGIEPMKAKYEKSKTDRDTFKTERDQYKTQHGDVHGKLQELEYYRQNDLGAFFKHANLSNDEVFGWVERQIDLEKNPEQKRGYESQTQRTQDNWQQTQTTQANQQRAMDMFEHQHNLAVKNTMMQPQVSDFVTKVDGIFGEGTFLGEVDAHGDKVWNTEKRYIYPDEAVKVVQARYNNLFEQMSNYNSGNGSAGAGSHGTLPSQAAPATQAKAPPPPPPPNLGSGSGRSPTFKSPSSTKELRDLAQKMGD